MSYQFDVALSFAGENRPYVEKVAKYLRDKGIRVHYDQFEDIELQAWGKDLMGHFHDIYQNQARYCVMFISQHYAKKAWPRHEKQSALARNLGEHGYILPVRFDDTEIPGIPSTIGYVDLNAKDPEDLGEMIIKKLGKEGSQLQPSSQSSSSSLQTSKSQKYRQPKVKKTFNPYQEGQDWLNFLEIHLKQRTMGANIDYSSFEKSGKRHFRFLRDGQAFYSMNIEMGGFHRDHGLSFSYAHGEMQPLSSGVNAWADFEWSTEKDCVVIKMTDFSVFSSESHEKLLTQQEFIDYIWDKVCDALEGRY